MSMATRNVAKANYAASQARQGLFEKKILHFFK